MTYYLADANGDKTLWRDNGEDDPTAVMARYETRVIARHDADELWTLILRGAGVDDDYITLAREDISELAEKVHTLAADIADGGVNSYGVWLLAKQIDELAARGVEVSR